MKKILGTILLAVLTGCATVGPDPQTLSQLQEPLICADKTECDFFWQRAQIWIANNSTYKIQTATDTIIETYGPMGTRVELAFRAIRIPNMNGSAQITLAAGCNNIFGCQPDKYQSILNFRAFVRGS
jgi:hypothetical protein